MQKETNALNGSEIGDVMTESEAQNTLLGASGENSSDEQNKKEIEEVSSKKNQPDNNSSADFEELIKGPFKDAFAKKVQSIINKRFKEQKIAESKSTIDSQNFESKNTQANAKNESEANKNKTDDSIYNSLIEAGVDPETAYRVLHLDEIMDSSMRYGAELAAKQLTESIRQKSARPSESALTQKGFSAKITANSLTPEKRKELAKKALMGEQIGF